MNFFLYEKIYDYLNDIKNMQYVVICNKNMLTFNGLDSGREKLYQIPVGTFNIPQNENKNRREKKKNQWVWKRGYKAKKQT